VRNCGGSVTGGGCAALVTGGDAAGAQGEACLDCAAPPQGPALRVDALVQSAQADFVVL
jgi:hypothetical protein